MVLLPSFEFCHCKKKHFICALGESRCDCRCPQVNLADMSQGKNLTKVSGKCRWKSPQSLWCFWVSRCQQLPIVLPQEQQVFEGVSRLSLSWSHQVRGHLCGGSSNRVILSWENDAQDVFACCIWAITMSEYYTKYMEVSQNGRHLKSSKIRPF